jgi:hypothetical protein
VWRLLFLSTSILAVTLCASPASVSAKRGAALYEGKEPLLGRIRDQVDLLPAETVRCANCHSQQSPSSRLLGKPAAHLDGAWLLEPRSRRAGPPSTFDLSSFCRLLRTGVDPVYIMIAREMPTYNLSDDQCASLWKFASAPGIRQ